MEEQRKHINKKQNMMHHGFDDDEEVVVLNREILKVSGGLRDNRFPKKYAVKHRWYMRVLAVIFPLFLLSPKVISPLLDGQTLKEAFSLQYQVWDGTYIYLATAYMLIFFAILLYKIPWSIEREREFFVVHFLVRSLRIPIDDVEELRLVRQWNWRDSLKVAQKSAGTTCGGLGVMQYEEVGPRKPVVKSFAAACCHPMDCLKIITSKLFWGSPFNCGRSTCALSVRGSLCENFIFAVEDMKEFALDNRPDYNCVPPVAEPLPMALGAASASFPLPPKIFLNDLEHQVMLTVPEAPQQLEPMNPPMKFGKPQEEAPGSSPATTAASPNPSPYPTPASGVASPWPLLATTASPTMEGMAETIASRNPLDRVVGTGAPTFAAQKMAAPSRVFEGKVADSFKELQKEMDHESDESSSDHGDGGRGENQV